MRHKVAGRHLNRNSAHRNALRRNLAASLFEHGTISTTRQKAKFVQPFAEKLITLAKDGSLHARRRAIALLQNRDIFKVEDGQPVKENAVINKLFSDIGPRFQNRNGGYTRIINLPLRRVGDNGSLVLLQLVGEKQASVSAKAPRRKPAPTTPETEVTPPPDAPRAEDQVPQKSPDAAADIDRQKEAEIPDDLPQNAPNAPELSDSAGENDEEKSPPDQEKT